MLVVNEIFGAAQGEGIYVGKPTVFIRFSGCNLSCTWCDTKYHSKGKEMSVEDILDLICLNVAPSVTLTGGEPMVQNYEELIELIEEIHSLGKEVYMETNGTKFYEPIYQLLDFISISPKLLSSGNKGGNYFEGLDEITHRVWATLKLQLKFVVKTQTDFEEVKSIINLFADYITPIIIQPCASPKENLDQYSKKAKRLLEMIQNDLELNKYNWRFLLQQHRVVYGKRKGV